MNTRYFFVFLALAFSQISFIFSQSTIFVSFVLLIFQYLKSELLNVQSFVTMQHSGSGI